ncbi:organic cation transporter -like [Brachionus plicatilis]|uniref:Organic cation transporter-like n=1 Tax=Brachionus plicatilis TaxID=10195 RepID=A0A3M7PDP6_BRAPC|nr:organic cation transporter -like [Brachionus plicatilis]
MSKKMSRLNKQTEEIFKQIGEFGPYQLFVFILVGILSFEPALVAYSFSFYGATPNHRCKIPNYENDTYEIQSEYHKQLIDKYIPKSKSGSFKNEYDYCNLKAFNQNSSNSTLIKCDKWVYSKKYFESTLTSDWNLVCDNAPKRSLFSTLYFSGSYGVLLSGILSDKLGRKKTAYLFVVSNAILNVGLFFVMSHNFGNQNLREILFGVLRLLIGIAANVYATAVVIGKKI